MKAVIAALLLAGCTTKPPVPEPPFAAKFRNACIPEAAAMVEGLREYQIPARVLLYKDDRNNGHAIATYRYGGHLWGWDSYWKSISLDAFWPEPLNVAAAWLKKTTPARHADEAAYY